MCLYLACVIVDRHCSLDAMEVLEYPKTNSRNGSKEETLLYFTFNALKCITEQLKTMLNQIYIMVTSV